MAANFFWSAVHTMLGEVTLMIRVSNRNMENVQLNGGPNDPRITNDRKLPNAIEQSMKAIDFVVEVDSKHLMALKCSHIDRAVESLGRWRFGPPWPWSELNVRSRAVRDAVETELKEYLYFQYPKAKRGKDSNMAGGLESLISGFP